MAKVAGWGWRLVRREVPERKGSRRPRTPGRQETRLCASGGSIALGAGSVVPSGSLTKTQIQR